MNPNNFIFNSDFITLAKNNSAKKIIVIPSAEIPSGKITTDGEIDIPIDTANGAIVMMLARYYAGDEPGPWVAVANALTFEDNGVDGLFWRVRFKRVNYYTLRMYWVCLSQAYHSGIVTPPITLELAISAFYPPNV